VMRELLVALGTFYELDWRSFSGIVSFFGLLGRRLLLLTLLVGSVIVHSRVDAGFSHTLLYSYLSL
jgi:hypothetical protein